ncbi:hypothetical protein BGZ81_005843 [Podila clonocystis]|nr:hypothetical protein BGZ81_005843 [Podila clonocystis]
MTGSQNIKVALYEDIKPTPPYLVSTEIPVSRDPTQRRPSRVVNYFKDMVTGYRFFPSVVSMVPGPDGIGIIKSAGPGLVHLKPGQMVFIDPTVLARDHPIAPVAAMQGFIGFGEGQNCKKSGATALGPKRLWSLPRT